MLNNHHQQHKKPVAAKSLQSCPTLRPHRRQPTRLPGPWDCPGKNTGVGCHFLLQCMKVKSESEVTQSYPTFSDPMDRSLLHLWSRLLHPWDFPGNSTGVGCHSLLPKNLLEPTKTRYSTSKDKEATRRWQEGCN